LVQHVTDYLPEFAIGELDAALRDQVETHLRACPPCAAWLAELKASLGPDPEPVFPGPEDAVTERARLPPLPPLPPLHAPIQCVRFRDLRVGEFERFAGRVGQLFGLERNEALQSLKRMENGAKWQQGPRHGLELMPLKSAGEGHAFFFRIQSGALYPRHKHYGDEVTLVLQGAFECNGARYWRGDRLMQRAGSVHSLMGLPGAACVCAVRIKGRLEFV